MAATERGGENRWPTSIYVCIYIYIYTQWSTSSYVKNRFLLWIRKEIIGDHMLCVFWGLWTTTCPKWQNTGCNPHGNHDIESVHAHVVHICAAPHTTYYISIGMSLHPFIFETAICFNSCHMFQEPPTLKQLVGMLWQSMPWGSMAWACNDYSMVMTCMI